MGSAFEESVLGFRIECGYLSTLHDFKVFLAMIITGILLRDIQISSFSVIEVLGSLTSQDERF